MDKTKPILSSTQNETNKQTPKQNVHNRWLKMPSSAMYLYVSVSVCVPTTTIKEWTTIETATTTTIWRSSKSHKSMNKMLWLTHIYACLTEPHHQHKQIKHNTPLIHQLFLFFFNQAERVYSLCEFVVFSLMCTLWFFLSFWFVHPASVWCVSLRGGYVSSWCVCMDEKTFTLTLK